jgi:hypothetical protein|tara:strand:- start:250 stop:762 length:513 start_codon:yes stop_codon:yes gene_type:complete
MTTVEEAKKRGPERHLTNKYNFAGPGTFYEARMKGSDFYENLMKEAGRKVVGTKPYNKPINKVDACAKIHDATYIDKNASAAKVKAADQVFQNCVSKVKPTDGIQQALLAKAAKIGFEGKLKVEGAGLVRKGSFAAGGDKHSALGVKVRGAVGLGMKAASNVRKGIKKIL